VAEELQNRGLVRLVVDPVLVSTSGDALATAGEWVALLPVGKRLVRLVVDPVLVQPAATRWRPLVS